MKPRFVFLLLLCSVLAFAGDTQPLTVEFAGVGGRQIASLFTWSPPQASAASEQLILEGKISRETHTEQSFRYDFYFEGPVQLPLTFERQLVAGTYKLRLKLYDGGREQLAEASMELKVPSSRSLGTAANPLLPANAIRLRLPEGDQQNLLAGKIEVEARVSGAAISRVDYMLDGKMIGQAKGEFFKTKLKLGDAPLVHDLRALARAGDRVVAEDRHQINLGPHAFLMRLYQPTNPYKAGAPVRVRAGMYLPQDGELERIDFFLDDELKVALYGPPYVVSLPKVGKDALGVKAVAWLKSGSRTADSILLNDQLKLDGIEVRGVDLWVNVDQKNGLPATRRFSEEDFAIFENDKPMEMTEFEEAENLPIHVSFLTDISGSMRDFLPEIVKGIRFTADEVLTPIDRASLLSFRDEPTQVVPFTTKKAELHAGLEAVISESKEQTYHGSGIYDSIVSALHHFGGIKGGALLVFTDGDDNRSGYGKGEVVAFAKQAGVRIYVFNTNPNTLNYTMQSLALETGGNQFKVETARMLPNFFRIVAAELRLQYLLRYQSSREPGDRKCRKIRVEVSGDNKVRTMRGYCP